MHIFCNSTTHRFTFVIAPWTSCTYIFHYFCLQASRMPRHFSYLYLYFFVYYFFFMHMERHTFPLQVFFSFFKHLECTLFSLFSILLFIYFFLGILNVRHPFSLFCPCLFLLLAFVKAIPFVFSFLLYFFFVR